MTHPYKSKFGLLNALPGPENNFIWTTSICSSNIIFSEKIPINIFTKDCKIPSDLIELVETIVLNIDKYLEISVGFIKKTLIEQKEKYKIREDEKDYLSLNLKDFPINVPELTFWEGSFEWIIRFAEGRFNICDPFGIAVTFSSINPISVDNLEEGEYIDH